MENGYELSFAKLDDLDSWMAMIEIVKDNFPGLTSRESINRYMETVIKNINRETALCVKINNVVVGILIFSFNAKCLSCMAVHPEHRKKGIATSMVEKMRSLFPDDADLSVTTFRENDPKGIAPRALYKKFGFVEDELIVEFEYPHQRFVLNR